MKYKNAIHKRVFTSFLKQNNRKYSNSFLAVIYLLSASKNLWKSARANIKETEIDLDIKKYPNLSCYEYTLLKLSDDIYSDTTHANLHDLADPLLISDKTYYLIFNAVKIARKGEQALKEYNGEVKS